MCIHARKGVECVLYLVDKNALVFFGYVIHIGVGSDVVCSTTIGNARASIRGMDNRTIPRFFMSVFKCLYVRNTDMNALPNVDIQGGETELHTLDLSPMSSPKNKVVREGVSSDYVQQQDHKWYVLRATYNRVCKANEIITKEYGGQVYLPMQYAVKQVNGKKKRILMPLLPNIIFVYATDAEIEKYVSRKSRLSLFLRYFRNRLEPRGTSGKHPPLTIGFREMMNFINATKNSSEHIKIVEKQQCHYKSGDMVQVINGDFKGVVGRVARVSGQQRVIIEIEGLCLVATAYIPTDFIKRIEF